MAIIRTTRDGKKEAANIITHTPTANFSTLGQWSSSPELICGTGRHSSVTKWDTSVQHNQPHRQCGQK
jgi:hypothetical protein